MNFPSRGNLAANTNTFCSRSSLRKVKKKKRKENKKTNHRSDEFANPLEGQKSPLPSCTQSCPTPSEEVGRARIYLEFGGMVVWDAVSAQTAAAAPHDARQRGNPWGTGHKLWHHDIPSPALPHLSGAAAPALCSAPRLMSAASGTFIKTNRFLTIRQLLDLLWRSEKEFPLQSLYLPRDFMASRFHLKHEGNAPIFHLARRTQLNNDKSRENFKTGGGSVTELPFRHPKESILCLINSIYINTENSAQQ